MSVFHFLSFFWLRLYHNLCYRVARRHQILGGNKVSETYEIWWAKLFYYYVIVQNIGWALALLPPLFRGVYESFKPRVFHDMRIIDNLSMRLRSWKSKMCPHCAQHINMMLPLYLSSLSNKKFSEVLSENYELSLWNIISLYCPRQISKLTLSVNEMLYLGFLALIQNVHQNSQAIICWDMKFLKHNFEILWLIFSLFFLQKLIIWIDIFSLLLHTVLFHC